MTAVIVVFAKAPRPGQVKTRMTPPLSPAEAAELYACLLDDVLEATAQSARAFALDAVLAVHPTGACGELARRAPAPFRVVGQRGSDLSQRMEWAVAEAAAAGAAPVLLRGSDSPALAPSVVGAALDALRECDVVFSPDRDGGYNLVGLRRAARGLFDHPMSTSSALADTMERSRRHGLTTRLLAPGFDLDTIADLRWLAEEKAHGSPPCPRTLAFLDERALWRHVERGR